MNGLLACLQYQSKADFASNLARYKQETLHQSLQQNLHSHKLQMLSDFAFLRSTFMDSNFSHANLFNKTTFAATLQNSQ
jgi:hypothetical protein